MENKRKEIIDSLKINPKDVGSSAVQIGLLSEKINNLTNHFKKNNRIFKNEFKGCRIIRSPNWTIK